MSSPAGSTLTKSARQGDRRAQTRLVVGVAAAIFLLDQASKFLVLEVLDLPTFQRLDVVAPFLVFVEAWNRGINFGFFGDLDMRWLLIGVAVVLSAGVVWWVRRRSGAWLGWGAGLVVGGALGNALDRVRFGAVFDFLNMSCCGFQNPYAFNVADIAIFAGAVIIAWKA